MDPFENRVRREPYHYRWTQLNQSQPPETATQSPLLDLGHSSDVNPLLPDQVADARQVLRWRRGLVDDGRTELRAEVLAGQRRIVERFLAGRRAYFGEEQSRPLPEVTELIREGRDIFVVIKFMDEAPHMAATLDSLLNQDVELGRVVILAVDNNSTDGTDEIVRAAIAANRTAARIVYMNQAMAGAGNAARLGVDTCIATVYEMCRRDRRWERLQSATIAVSDGDTVYHPAMMSSVASILDDQPTVDGVMPFLTYKFTAALRLLGDYTPAYPQALSQHAEGAQVTAVPVDLSSIRGHDELPRWERQLLGDELLLTTRAGVEVRVPLSQVDEHGRRFGVLADPSGRLAYAFADRTVVLAEAPVAGFDAALVFLENGGVRREEKWRWHSVIGHDLFLYWSFRGMGLPESVIFPDSSDAMKTFRVWSFAIGGQHQLKRTGLRIATGSDYQSGRVLQAVGCTLRLGPAEAFAETETDRLIKMVRNFVRRQSVFYGETRSSSLERATGLYVHMTRIQGQIEQELREYADDIFAETVFPERVIFPLRWMLQNAVRFYAHGPQERQIVQDRFLGAIFSAATSRSIQDEILTDEKLRAMAEAPYSDSATLAEKLAEEIMLAHYPEIMIFYRSTLRSFFAAHRVSPEHYEWLLDGLPESRNGLTELPPRVDPADVWDGTEFEIDEKRGQVVSMRRQSAP
ncbi:hypothetical protein F4553_003404 [Allocatelliglobosispora scoriae]|uniref:Glycosyltransferase 2-like domain-containing protein n=1 Tax=Allocatelliglobosispora scoriae TaxID=643052 RepID=A0A841BQP8_9ACTN|nr:glycosyltransferase family A protein [Allocatelliglobosispora scoriae]MBB5870025.1 hypothetical protein [Allocatelliglobosispora scoriae]